MNRSITKIYGHKRMLGICLLFMALVTPFASIVAALAAGFPTRYVTTLGSRETLTAKSHGDTVFNTITTPGASGPALVQAATFTVNSPGDAADFALNGDCDTDAGTAGSQCTLRAAIQESNSVAGDDTINFSLAPGSTITLASALELIFQNVTITGPGANLLTIQRSTAPGTPQFRLFHNLQNVTTTISGVTLTNADTSDAGGAIRNSGLLTLDGVTLFNNHSNAGAAIFTSTASSNLTITNSTVSANRSDAGAAIYNQSGRMTITNTTLTGNTNMGTAPGSAIWIEGATSNAAVTNCTVTQNTGQLAAIFRNGSGLLTVRNSIVAGNTPGDTSGIANLGNNLIGGSPLLAPLANYGGPTQTMALLPGSPAINAGTTTDAPATDQRGIGRVGSVDIGAFESRGFTIAATSGTPQSTGISSAFSSALVATVSSAFSEPVAGGAVTFTAPASGVSGTFTGGVTTVNVTTSAGGVATAPTFTANATTGGPYNVTAGGNGIASLATFSLSHNKRQTTTVVTSSANPSEVDTLVTFTVTVTPASGTGTPTGTAQITENGNQFGLALPLNSNGVGTFTTNEAPMGSLAIKAVYSGDATFETSFGTLAQEISCSQTVVVTNSSDFGPGSMRDVVTKACAGSTITFDMTPGKVTSPINMQFGEIVINRNLTIQGPGANLLTVQRNSAEGVPLFSIFSIFDPNVTATIFGLTLSGAESVENGGAIRNLGALTLDGLTISDNHTTAAGSAVYNGGNLTLTNSTLSGNRADSGGAIFNQGTVSITNSTLTGNTNPVNEPGSAISNGSDNLAHVTNCTISQNTGQTVFAQNGGGTGKINLKNSIVAGNIGGDALAGGAMDLGNNLIGGSPLLAPLGNYGGPTQTIALLPGSPAINAGTTTGAPVTDQRGISRVGAVDIGAFESRGFAISATSGTPQSATINTAFSSPVVATVTSAFDEPLVGGTVTFAAPGLGVGGTFPGNLGTVNVVIGAGGVATAPTFTANSSGGPYNVTAGGNGFATAATFSLTNNPAATTTAITSSLNPSDFGLTVTFTATVTSAAGTPTGTVQFKDNGANLDSPLTLNATGVATLATSSLTVGTHTITADYLDGTSFTASSGTLAPNQQVNCPATVVTNNADSGTGSLRDIISRACPGATITFAANLISPVTLTSAEIVIDKNLTIQGPGANLLTVQRSTAQGTPLFRIFSIANQSVTATISGLTLSGANSGENGGAIRNLGTLILDGVTISNNFTTADGAGIYNGGNLTVGNTTFTGNKALGLTSDGGAISSDAGTLTVINSTISGNSANDSGGGLFNGGTSTANFVNVTITNNNADADMVFGPLDLGGGIRQSSSLPITLRNTIVAGNFVGIGLFCQDRFGEGPPLCESGPSDLLGNADGSSSHNLIGTLGSGGLINGVNNNQVGVPNARLGTLAGNGGPTQTHALLSGSPALDAGDDSVTGVPLSLTTDQRGTGFPRKADGPDANTTQTVDIGAFEADPSVEDISDKSTSEDVALPTFIFNVGDAATAFTNITTTSNNPTLVPVGSIVVGPDTASTRTLSITPPANEFGSTTITVTVTRGEQSMSDTFRLTVNAVNDPPSFTNGPDQTVAEDSAAQSVTNWATSISPGANESGQTLSFQVTGNTNPGLFSAAPAVSPAGTLTYTPAANANGSAMVTLALMDNVGGANTSPSQTLIITVTEVNDAPAAGNETLAPALEDVGTITIPFVALTGNDSSGPGNESSQSLVVKTVSNATGGTVSIVGGNVLFTTAANYHGAASFQYTIEDNGTTNGVADPKTSAAATASFNVIAVADTPSVTSATTNANTQTTTGLVISRNPADGAEVTHFKINGITGGALFKNNGTTPINNGDFITFAEGNAGLKFTPGTSNGSFTVQASVSAADAGLGGATATANITVNPLGGVLRFSAANYSVAEGAGSRTITVERTGDTSQAVTVDYASSDHSNPPDFIPCTSPGAGLASSRCDFTTAVGTLRFAAGETSRTFNVLISQDSYVEGPETLSLTLSNLTGGAVFGTPATANVEIVDDATEPGTNPIDTSSEFVRSQYHDLLNREPDAPGLAFWTDNIEKCNDPARRPAGQTVEQCVNKQRESTAVAFFMSPELQITGGFVYRLYKGSLTGAPNYDGGSPGRFPTSLEFMRDVSQVSEGIVVNNQISGAVVEANRNRLAAEFVERPEFLAKYGGLNNTLYVEELFNTTTIAATAGEKQALVDGLTNGTETRGSVLRKVVDGTVVINEGNVQFTTSYGEAFYNQEFRRVFVYMEYVGYLRRNPDQAGYNFWLGKLNSFNGDPFQAEMVLSFILSPEYRSRFGQP